MPIGLGNVNAAGVRSFFVESFVEPLFKIRDGPTSRRLEAALRSDEFFSRTFLVLPRDAARPPTWVRTYRNEFGTTKGRRDPYRRSPPTRGRRKSLPVPLRSAGTFHVSSGETTLLSRSGDRIPPRSGFYFIGLKGVKYRRQGPPSTYIPTREFSGNPPPWLPPSPRRSPFCPV